MANTIYMRCRATLQAERRTLEQMLERDPSDALRVDLKEIDDALFRLLYGHFGICEQCKRTIPDEELGHTPTARYCAECIDIRRPVITSPGDVE